MGEQCRQGTLCVPRAGVPPALAARSEIQKALGPKVYMHDDLFLLIVFKAAIFGGHGTIGKDSRSDSECAEVRWFSAPHHPHSRGDQAHASLSHG